MTQKFEFAVVGAGPAGARAAELLSSLGARVALVDPKAPWEKPCGGGLTPAAFDEIPELEELKAFARPVTTVRVEASPEVGVTVPLARPMWILSRLELGRWQLDRALSAGSTHLPAKVEKIAREHGYWRLRTADGDIVAPILVGADGAASLVRRVAAPKFQVELAPTRVAYPRTQGITTDTALLKFYRGLAGYLWDFPRPGHRSVGIGVPNGTWRRPRLDGEIADYRVHSDGCVCGDTLERAGAVIGTAQLGHGDYSAIAGRDFALLGDAAGLADPLTGEGIQNALRSSELLARAWVEGGIEEYPALARHAFEGEFRVARFIRRAVFERESGLRLIEKSVKSRGYYAAMVAVVNAVNEHDAGAVRLLTRWARAYLGDRWPGQVASARPPREVCACGCSTRGHAEDAGCELDPVAA